MLIGPIIKTVEEKAKRESRSSFPSITVPDTPELYRERSEYDLSAHSSYPYVRHSTPMSQTDLGQPYDNRPTYDTFRPTYDIPRPTYDIPRPTYDIPRPTYDISRPTYDISRPTYDTSRPPYDNSRSTYDISRPMYDISRQASDISNNSENERRTHDQRLNRGYHEQLLISNDQDQFRDNIPRINDRVANDFQGLPPSLRADRFRITTPVVRREKEPEKFDGKSTDWKDYIVHFEQAAKWNRWTDFEKAQQLSMSLRGTAQKLLGDLKYSVVNDYDALKDILGQRFNPRERVTAYRCEFRARKRKSGEAIPDFGYALRRLVRLAYPDDEYSNILEQLVINQFILGLAHVEMEKHVQFAHPTTLETAIAQAVEFEAFTNAQEMPRKPKAEEFSYKIAAINKENKQNKEEKLEKQVEVQNNSEIKEIITSFNKCFEKISEKLDDIKKPTRETNQKSFYRDRREPIECWKCGKKGHIERYCYIDTGAVASVISKFSFDKLKLSTALLEEVQTTLTAVDGEEIKVYGQIKLKFTISNKVFVHTFVVAEVYETSGIFGMDFLEKFDAILFVSKSHMIIAGHKIRLYKLGFTTCAHIKLAEKVVIPPESELTIKGNVFGQKLNTPSVLEPRKDFYKDGLLMTRTLCHESDRHIFVNAINLTSQAIHLPKETLIGKLDTVVSIQPIKKENKIEENIEQVCLPEHLKCLIDNASPELTSEQRQQLEKCIFEYQDIFSSPDGKLGRTGIVKHSIDTGDAKPVRVPPRRIPLGQKQVIETEIDKMLKNDVIEPSNSAWSSPVLLVTKKDNSVRFCVDFRALNSLTQESTPVAMTTREIERASENDPELKAVRECLVHSQWHRIEFKEYLPIRSELCAIGQLVLRGTRIVIPISLREQVLQLAHEGHPGIVVMKTRFCSGTGVLK
ncbi:unnamed protein product [Mytilus edulis]|uniref:CCHC-type domain-containing protein n=1 Tax=Mytilus edulis TaxID=6550 RepID=A0A8S3RES0_MYTED|nr:unnamed protein product [Mytilus edulis]